MSSRSDAGRADRELAVEAIRRAWSKAPLLSPTILNGNGFTVVAGHYETRREAERVRDLVEAIDGDIPQLLVAAMERLVVGRAATCESCGEEFEDDTGSRTFCSRRCAWRKTRSVTCEQCGVEFYNDSGTRKYCSRECFGLARRKPLNPDRGEP